MPAFFVVFHGEAPACRPDVSGYKEGAADRLMRRALHIAPICLYLIWLGLRGPPDKSIIFVDELCNICIYTQISRTKPY